MLLLFIALVLLLTLAAGFILYFRLRRPGNKTVSDNSLLLQYKSFIDLVLAEQPGARLLQTKTNAFQIQRKDHESSSSLSVTKVEDRIILVWNWHSPGFGDRGKEWAFNHDYSQQQMFEEIKQSRDAYVAALYQKYNMNQPEKVGKA